MIAEKSENVKKYKNKMGMFDFIKGVAIFFVVLCHVLANLSGNALICKINEYVCAVSLWWMAVFFVASGYWFSPKKVTDYTAKRLSQFAKQYIGVGVFTVCCYAIIHFVRFHSVRMALRGSIGFVLGFLLGNKHIIEFGMVTVYDIGPLWFLLALCLGDVILNLVLNVKWIRNKWFAVIVLAVAGVVLGYSLWIPFCLSAALTSVLCLYVGYRVRQSKYLISIWGIRDYIGVIVLAAAGMTVAAVGILVLGYEEINLQMVAGIPSAVLLLRVGLIAERAKNKLVSLFKHLGRYTLWILMVHTVEMLSIDWSVLVHKSFFVNHPLISLLAVLVVRWGIIAVGCMMISKVGNLLNRRKIDESAG